VISGRELAFGLLGAWRLVRNDASGLQYFDRTPQGALRSFWVMLLVAPAYAILVMLALNRGGVFEIGLRQILLAGGIYIVGWLLFPVILLRLAPRLGREREVPGYIAANNWTQILITALSLFLSAVATAVSNPIAELFNLALLALVGLMQYRLLRHTMALTPPQCGLLVFAYLSLDLALSLLLLSSLVPVKLAA
jgi:hypothetical protein